MARLRLQPDLGLGPQSYSLDARRSGGSKRHAWRRRTKRTQIQKTPMEKARIAAVKKARKDLYNKAFMDAGASIFDHAKILSETFGLKDADRSYQELMQRARIANTKRSKSRWNAFLRDEVKRRNDGMLAPVTLYSITNIIQELPDHQTRLKASAYAAEVSAAWNAMTDEEKTATTSESLIRLQEHRENKALAYHNSSASAFKDAQSTLVSIKKEVVFSQHPHSGNLTNR
jgi:hypothetical protein